MYRALAHYCISNYPPHSNTRIHMRIRSPAYNVPRCTELEPVRGEERQCRCNNVNMLTRLLFCRRATSFILIFIIGNEALLMRIDPDEYVPFISDVSLYYKSTGVFFLYDDLSESESGIFNIGVVGLCELLKLLRGCKLFAL